MTVEAHIGRERRLHPRHSLLAFKRFEQRAFLAADISAGAVMNVNVEGPAVYVVLADEIGRIGFLDRCPHPGVLEPVLAANVDVAGMRLHGEGGDEAAFDQKVRIVAQDFAILAGARLGFVRIDDEIGGPRRVRLRHEGPFEAGRKAGAAAPAQARGLHLIDDPVLALVDDGFGIVPAPARLRALQAPVAEAVEIEEDAVLVFEHRGPQCSPEPGSTAGGGGATVFSGCATECFCSCFMRSLAGSAGASF